MKSEDETQAYEQELKDLRENPTKDPEHRLTAISPRPCPRRLSASQAVANCRERLAEGVERRRNAPARSTSEHISVKPGTSRAHCCRGGIAAGRAPRVAAPQADPQYFDEPQIFDRTGLQVGPAATGQIRLRTTRRRGWRDGDSRPQEDQRILEQPGMSRQPLTHIPVEGGL